MNQTNRSIFRKEAVEKYIREQENRVLPGFVSPRLFLFFWIVFMILCGLGVWLCFAKVPMFVFGQGMFVDRGEGNPCQGHKSCIVAFFTPDIQPRLASGKNLMIRSKNQGLWIESPIAIVASEVLPPFEIRKRYRPAAGGMTLPAQSAAVAVCRIDRQDHDMRSDLPFDEAFEVRIRAGTRRLGSFVPLLGRFFGKTDRPGKEGT